MTDEEKLMLVETNLENVDINAKANLYFGKTSDNRYFIATLRYEDEKPNVGYYIMDFAEMSAFSREISAVLEEDKQRVN